ncbi:hypothetical protein [Streptomyces sp. NPDC054794]
MIDSGEVVQTGTTNTVLDLALAGYHLGMDAVRAAKGVPNTNEAQGYVLAVAPSSPSTRASPPRPPEPAPASPPVRLDRPESPPLPRMRRTAMAHFDMQVTDEERAEIDGHPLVPEPGQSVHDAVRDRLQQYTQERAAAVEATVNEGSGAAHFVLQVSPDGSSRVLDPAEEPPNPPSHHRPRRRPP